MVVCIVSFSFLIGKLKTFKVLRDIYSYYCYSAIATMAAVVPNIFNRPIGKGSTDHNRILPILLPILLLLLWV
ncbi:MAG: hypothetical protein RMJ36_07165 [Candidatus Calescibacterium sp.]|nr:hypothetical protein [Candidatus Calescibacterium sp.]MDW8133414.1 hypothetical protein [Candidatus Calescibacterium sp.]